MWAWGMWLQQLCLLSKELTEHGAVLACHSCKCWIGQGTLLHPQPLQFACYKWVDMAVQLQLHAVCVGNQTAGYATAHTFFFAYDPSEYNLLEQFPVMSNESAGQCNDGNVGSIHVFSMQIMWACFHASGRYPCWTTLCSFMRKVTVC